MMRNESREGWKTSEKGKKMKFLRCSIDRCQRFDGSSKLDESEG